MNRGKHLQVCGFPPNLKPREPRRFAPARPTLNLGPQSQPSNGRCRRQWRHEQKNLLSGEARARKNFDRWSHKKSYARHRANVRGVHRKIEPLRAVITHKNRDFQVINALRWSRKFTCLKHRNASKVRRIRCIILTGNQFTKSAQRPGNFKGVKTL